MQRIAALFATIVFVTSCANLRVYSEVAPDTNLGQYRTYAWVPLESTPEHPESILDQEIKRALKRALARRGLVEDTTGTPDFLVGYHVLREHKVAVTDWGSGIYGWAPEVKSYTEGTLIVHLIDPKTNRVFWFGSATGAVEHPGVVNPTRLNKAVTSIVDRYPSQIAAAGPTKM